jgi:hypothetical protein
VFKIELKIVKDEKGVVVGFDLMSDCSAEEDSSVRSLPCNLRNGSAKIKIAKSTIVIKNANEPELFFMLDSPEEFNAIKAYLEADDTEPHADLGGFNRRVFEARFDNKRIHSAELIKSRNN